MAATALPLLHAGKVRDVHDAGEDRLLLVASDRVSAFDVVMRGSPAEGARLEMIDLAGRALCYDCMKTVEIADRLDPCPDCGGGKLIPNGGDEMRIRDMEVV